jgi:O-phosphoseryl-tRNA(Cys) synthetase
MFSDFSKVTPSIIASQIAVRVWSKVKSLSDLNVILEQIILRQIIIHHNRLKNGIIDKLP